MGEGLSQPFTSHNPSVYRGFRLICEEGRVKTKVRFFPSKATLSCSGRHIPNGDGRPPEIFLPMHHFVPGNGKKLPQLGAILCHSQAISGMRLFSCPYLNPQIFLIACTSISSTCFSMSSGRLQKKSMPVRSSRVLMLTT